MLGSNRVCAELLGGSARFDGLRECVCEPGYVSHMGTCSLGSDEMCRKMRGLHAQFDRVSKCTCAPGFVFSPSGFCISLTHASMSTAAPVGGENERERESKKRVSGLAATRALRTLFDALDRDEDGALSREELVAALPPGLPLAPVEHLVSKEQRAAWLQVPVLGHTCLLY